jgi:hypothetical protein
MMLNHGVSWSVLWQSVLIRNSQDSLGVVHATVGQYDTPKAAVWASRGMLFRSTFCCDFKRRGLLKRVIADISRIFGGIIPLWLTLNQMLDRHYPFYYSDKTAT